jgi:hypothetical protein
MAQQKPENPAVQELRAIRKELIEMKMELKSFRDLVEFRKPPDIKDQVAKGVIIAGLAWFAIIFLLQILAFPFSL